jgi:hypothetical protein
MGDHQNEAQLMGTGSDLDTVVLLKSYQWHTSQAYSLEKSIPKQYYHLYQTQLCPQYVPVEMLSFLIFIRGRGHQLDSTKNYFHPTNALCATTWYSIPYGHVPLEAWLFCSARFIGLLARNIALLRRILTVRLLMFPLTIHRLHSMFAVLNGCCLVSPLRSLSF